MPRWLLFTIGLGIAVAGLYAILLEWPGGPPLDRIDDESRDQLERVLRQPDDADAPAR
ncbi:MAG: hypothetical protein JSU66_03445 [Deltaproteobacteria bacterium]|nr:MAG: hypothetical protein JSU66_03445 [Deltaproteobacteria bacterium]